MKSGVTGLAVCGNQRKRGIVSSPRDTYCKLHEHRGCCRVNWYRTLTHGMATAGTFTLHLRQRRLGQRSSKVNEQDAILKKITDRNYLLDWSPAGSHAERAVSELYCCHAA